MNTTAYAHVRGVDCTHISRGLAHAALREARERLDEFEVWVRDTLPMLKPDHPFRAMTGDRILNEMRDEYTARVAECEENLQRFA